MPPTHPTPLDDPAVQRALDHAVQAAVEQVMRQLPLPPPNGPHPDQHHPDQHDPDPRDDPRDEEEGEGWARYVHDGELPASVPNSTTRDRGPRESCARTRPWHRRARRAHGGRRVLAGDQRRAGADTECLGEQLGDGGGGWMPVSVLVGSRHIDVGGQVSASLVVTGYPREVGDGWLAPLTSYPARVDVSVHIDPVPAAVAAASLRRRLARLESMRTADQEHGRLTDPTTEAATTDATELAAALARGQTSLARVGVVITVRASDERELGEHVAAVRALASSLLIDAQPTPFRALAGWVSGLPLGLYRLGSTRTMDIGSLAASFPFACPGLPSTDPVCPAPSGTLWGTNAAGGGGLVFWDRYDGRLPNHNMVILAQSGAGKSYLTKLDLLRGLYRGVRSVVIDPGREYLALAHAVGANVLRLGEPTVQINPFDLPPGPPTTDAYSRRCLYLHTVLEVLLGARLSPKQRLVADQAIHATYHAAGITTHPATWHRRAPLLTDLAEHLAHHRDPTGAPLAAALRPYTHGSFRVLFTGPTTLTPDPNSHLTVYSLAGLPDELRAVGILTALDATWRAVTTHTPGPDGLIPARSVVVDEAWQLMHHRAGAMFLHRLAKSARKHRTGLVFVSQDLSDLLTTSNRGRGDFRAGDGGGGDLGAAICANAATQVLMRTHPHALDQISAAFGLTPGWRDWLAAAPIGAALLIGAGHHIPVLPQASDAEHALITTDPTHQPHHSGLHPPPPTTPATPAPGRERPVPGWADEQDPL